MRNAFIRNKFNSFICRDYSNYSALASYPVKYTAMYQAL